MGKFTIEVFPERCTGCLRCALACSHLHTGAFNPSRARISILPPVDGRSVSFAPDCAGCGICADECLFGTLVKRTGRATP